MKIDPNMVIGSVTPAAPKASRNATGSFEGVLQGLETGTVQKAGVVHAGFRQAPISPQKLQAVGVSEEALDLMERYSRAVADPAVTPRALAPMVDEMDAVRSRVDEASTFLSDDDPLRAVMKDVSSALYGEVLRFRRGELNG
ncbi:MAG TPA: hypothetical protein PLR71_10795 [Deltaproteobacteria bacterium]|nr:hypothetical protein [Deltaproteobacteria bacterium]